MLLFALIAVKCVLITDANPPANPHAPNLFQRWTDAFKLNQIFGVQGMDSPVRSDGHGLLAAVVGTGAGATAQMMALGYDARFDLSHAYWVVAGTAAGNPDRVSLGTAVWVRMIINGDEAFERDRADAPGDWPYGVVPLTGAAPKTYPAARKGQGETVVFPLNAELVQRAFDLSKAAALPDRRELREERGLFAGYESAIRLPAVVLGDVIGCSRYWHGRVLTQWASDWAQYWTGGHGVFSVADTSDQAIAAALRTLGKAQRADFQRVLVLRAVANYTVPPGGKAHDHSLDVGYPGFEIAADAAFRATSPVITDLLKPSIP